MDRKQLLSETELFDSSGFTQPAHVDSLNDSINILLTEVSLEMLSNRIFDIDGQHVDSLHELYDPPPARTKQSAVAQTPAADDSDLMVHLRVAPTASTSTAPASTKPATGKKRKSQPEAQASTSSQPAASSASKTAETDAEKQDKGEAIARLEEEIQTLMLERKLEGFQQHFDKELADLSLKSDCGKMEHFFEKYSSHRHPNRLKDAEEFATLGEYHAIEKRQLLEDAANLYQLLQHIVRDPRNAHGRDSIRKDVSAFTRHLDRIGRLPSKSARAAIDLL